MSIRQIKGTILALAATTAFSVTYTAIDLTEEIQENDAPIVLQENTADNPTDREPLSRLVADLKERGWTTNPADRCECLYPPE